MRRFCILPLMLWAACAQARTLVLSADLWCPYNCDPASDHPGFAVEIARAIFARTGRSVEYRVVTWSRSIVEAQAGRIDGIISASAGEAPELIYAREPVGMSLTGFAVRRSAPRTASGVPSFDGKVIGAVSGYVYSDAPGDYIRSHAAEPDRVQFLAGADALAMNLRKLAAGRVDIVLDDADVLALTIDRLGLGVQLRIDTPGAGSPVFMAFSRAVPDGLELARTFDAGMASLRASGRLAAILGRYKIRDWK